jgi:cell division protein FtsQ
LLRRTQPIENLEVRPVGVILLGVRTDAAITLAGRAVLSGGVSPVVPDTYPARRGCFGRRRRNRRAVVQRRSLLLMTWAALGRLVRGAWLVGKVLGKIVAVLAVLGGAAWGGRWTIRHIVDSPRFQLTQVEIGPTQHVRHDELLALAGVALGDKLLSIDTDGVAARLATHPWVARAQVKRHLPSVLHIDLVERRAAALASLAGLYLVDENGRPFKRARMDEADGLPVLTGISREQYAKLPEASAAVFREALAILDDYRSRPGRPALSEVNIDTYFGFSLIVLEGGAELRLGREAHGGEYSKKLAQFDQILEAVDKEHLGGLSAVRVVNLDLGGRQVPVSLRGRDGDVAAEKPASRPARN